MKFYPTLSILLLLTLTVSCKKDKETKDKNLNPNCTELLSPVKASYPEWISGQSSLRTDVFSDGYVLGREFTGTGTFALKLFDTKLESVPDFLISDVDRFGCFGEDKIMTATRTENKQSRGGMSGLSGYIEDGRGDDCERSFYYGNDNLSRYSIDSKTIVRTHSRNGAELSEISLDGHVLVSVYRSENWKVDSEEGAYVATLDVDSLMYYPIFDQNLTYQDTIVANSNDGVIRIYHIGYEGDVIWDTKLEGVIQYGANTENVSFGATRNFLWVFTDFEVYKFNFSGLLVEKYCNELDLAVHEFLSGGIYAYNKKTQKYLLVDEGLDIVKEVNYPGLIIGSSGNQLFYNAIDFNSGSAVQKIESIDMFTEQKRVWWQGPFSEHYFEGYISRGCDGSFYGVHTNPSDNSVVHRVRITKDGKM